jgi:hypothetical protein
MMTVSQRIFHLLLFAYPREFRHEYGSQMTQLFRDCYREQTNRSAAGLWVLWLHTVSDLFVSAPREHLERLRRESSVMTNPQRTVMTVGACLAIIVVAFLLLSYGRSHQVTSILFFGKALDALVTAGLLGNLIIFLLRLTRFDPVKSALWAMLIVNSILFVLAWAISSRVDPQFNLPGLLIAYVVSFLFWSVLHWLWTKSKGDAGLALSSGTSQ